MSTLVDLYKQHEGKVTDKWELYLREYERLFFPYREQSISMLEIGIQNGGSLEIWSQYFSNAKKIVGCDIDQSCRDLVFSDPRISVVVGDACAEETKNKITEKARSFDLIIDDGSHRSTDIITTFLKYFPLLRKGGVFIVEDLHCGYWQDFEGGLFYPYSSISFFKTLADLINREHWGITKTPTSLISGFQKKYDIAADEKSLSEIHSIEFINSLCVIKKEAQLNNKLGKRVVVGKHDDILHGPIAVSGKSNKATSQSSNAWTVMEISPAEHYEGLNQALTERDGEITNLNHTVEDVRSSRSWQITAPVRFIGYQLRRVRQVFRLIKPAIRKGGGLKNTTAKAFQLYRREGIAGIRLGFRWVASADRFFSIERSEENNLDQYLVEPPKYVPRIALDAAPFEKVARVIAFYLPQFHPIPENDEWWGKGFTEWTNVKPAKPQFEGHYQPHIPDDFLGYYDLRDTSVMLKQIELAKQYGIEGFCFYTYWFSSHRLLETPVDNYLADTSLDLPFCICWANENWSRRWDGMDQDLLIEQNYSPEDDLAFITHISKYLRDDRYIRVEGKPLLIVYRPNLFPDMKATVKRWRNWCRVNGVGEIYLAYQQSFEAVDPAQYGLDAAIEFPPNNSGVPNITSSIKPISSDFTGSVFDWNALVEWSRDYVQPEYTLFRGVSPSWDNTARRKRNGTILLNSSPRGYQEWLFNAIEDTQKRFANTDQRLIFVNAWNEWAEGAHLEPDQAYGYAYLEATRLAQVRSNVIRFRETKQSGKLAIIIHGYYIDVLEQLLNCLPASIKTNAVLFITTVEEHADAVKKLAAATEIPHQVMVLENHGRDVLPFLKVLRAIEGLGFSHVLKLHTKKSLHRDDGSRWRDDLYDKLLDPRLADQVRPYFAAHPEVGLIGPAGYIAPISYYWGFNRHHVENLSRRLGIAKLCVEEQQFIAGTMFYARFDALKPLLQLALTDEDFEAEAGQVDGTLAHAIERAIALSAEAVDMGIVSSDRVIGSGESGGVRLEEFYRPDTKAN